MLKEWNINASLIHLNHAAVGPWPLRTQAAVEKFARENTTQGSLNYPQWLTTEKTLRDNLARLIGCPDSSNIALLKNTSEALSVVAHGLEFNAGDNIVISNQEFPSNRIVWESLQDQGVAIRKVDLDSAPSPEQALIAACDDKTRVLSISSVQFATGLRINLHTLGEYCFQNATLFCVDAIQSVGAEPLDVEHCHIDFLAADGHKWMLAPEGLAVFYCRKPLINNLHLHQFGWHMMENPGDFDSEQWQPASDARRFECGSPNMLGIHALNASVSLLLEIGMERVEKLIRAKVDYLYRELETIPHIKIITPASPAQRLGIISFRSTRYTGEQMFHHLTNKGVFCALRSGNVRLSPHYYTPDTQLQTVIQFLQEM